MKCQNCGPRWGKLVHQLSRVLTLAYDLYLGPHNSSKSLGLKKFPKIINYATIKENEKLKETMVGVQVE